MTAMLLRPFSVQSITGKPSCTRLAAIHPKSASLSTSLAVGSLGLGISKFFTAARIHASRFSSFAPTARPAHWALNRADDLRRSFGFLGGKRAAAVTVFSAAALSLSIVSGRSAAVLRPAIATLAAALLLSGCASDGGVHVATTMPIGADARYGSVKLDLGYFPPANFALSPLDSPAFLGLAK